MDIILKLKTLLNDSFYVEGDFLDLRVHNANIFMHLLAVAQNQNRIAYGLDTWNGLGAPTKKDLCISSYFIHNKGAFSSSKSIISEKLNREMANFPNYRLIDNLSEIPEDKKLSFIVLDKILYEPTKHDLQFLWDRVNYGGSIFIPEYESNSFGADLAIQEFLKERENSVILNRQLLIEGQKEKCLIIKCFNEKNKPNNWDKISKREEKKITVAMVLKTGGVYDYTYVNALAAAVRRNTTKDIEIACLTDNSTGFSSDIDKIIPFKHDYPKWWGKIELFRPDLFVNEHVFYIDLDTVIIDNIDEILEFQYTFCGLRDFYKLVSVGSGLMSWNSPEVHKIYTEFLKKDHHVISSYNDGDQQWINHYKPRTIYFQDIFSKEIISFKKDCLKPDGSISIPDKAKIICFHGNPRPHTILNPIIKNHWKPDK